LANIPEHTDPLKFYFLAIKNRTLLMAGKIKTMSQIKQGKARKQLPKPLA